MPDGLLGIHLIGAGYGESIIIGLPHGKVGVIDCYSSALNTSSTGDWLDANPTLRFLHDDLRVESLAFLALTHPHEDHGRGLSQILSYYKGRIEEIWIFDTYQDIYLQKYFEALCKNKKRLTVERLLGEKPGVFAVELMKIRNLVREQLTGSNTRPTLRRFREYQQFRLDDEPIEFHFLGPDTALVDEYESRLVENLQGVIDENGRDVSGSWEPQKVNHNEVSPAIVLEFGDTRLVFGGDMEAEGWQRVAAEQRSGTLSRPALSCCFFKVSHHASKTGYCNGLHEMLFPRRRGVAALTPFRRGSSSLPDLDTLEHLVKCAGEVLATDKHCTEIKRSNHSQGVGQLCPEWGAILMEHPEWSGALDSSVIETSDSRDTLAALPADAIPRVKSNSELVRSLRDDLWEELPARLDDRMAEKDYRLSFFFNDHAQELKRMRYVGRCAGRISDG